MHGEACLANIVLDRRPALPDIERPHRRPRDQVHPLDAKCSAAIDGFLQKGRCDTPLAHRLVDPQRGQPRRQFRPRGLVIVNYQRVAAGLSIQLRDEREGNARRGIEEVLEPVPDRLQRCALVPPEGLPYPLGNGVGMLGTLAQIVDRKPQARLPSSSSSPRLLVSMPQIATTTICTSNRPIIKASTPFTP